MNGSAFELGSELNDRRVRYILSDKLWTKYDVTSFSLDFRSWPSIKYLNDTGSALNDEVKSIPRTEGGLYLFYVPCPILPGITEFPLYIGRAQKTSGQNLRKRVREYFQHYDREDERPKIYKMLRIWGKQLRVAYHVLEENTAIIDLEKKIINSTLLPMNDEIPDSEIKAAVKAFEL
jgi:hypothetical protein